MGPENMQCMYVAGTLIKLGAHLWEVKAQFFTWLGPRKSVCLQELLGYRRCLLAEVRLKK